MSHGEPFLHQMALLEPYDAMLMAPLEPYDAMQSSSAARAFERQCGACSNRLLAQALQDWDWWSVAWLHRKGGAVCTSAPLVARFTSRGHHGPWGPDTTAPAIQPHPTWRLEIAYPGVQLLGPAPHSTNLRAVLQGAQGGATNSSVRLCRCHYSSPNEANIDGWYEERVERGGGARICVEFGIHQHEVLVMFVGQEPDADAGGGGGTFLAVGQPDGPEMLDAFLKRAFREKAIELIAAAGGGGGAGVLSNVRPDNLDIRPNASLGEREASMAAATMPSWGWCTLVGVVALVAVAGRVVKGRDMQVMAAAGLAMATGLA